VASRSKDPPGSYTPHKVLWPQDRRIHVDPIPLTRFCGLRIGRSTWILHPSQGSGASGSKDPPGSYTPHRVLGPQNRRIHLSPTPLTWFCGLGIVGSTSILYSHKVLWPQDRRIREDPTPFTRFCGLRIEGSTRILHPSQGFCGLRVVGSAWILYPSQGSVASGSKDPPGSYTPHKVLWPQDRKIHLDPTPLTRFCRLKIEGSTWILHTSQSSVASGDRRIRVDPTPLTGFSGLRIEGSTWILHALQGAVAGSMHDPMCCTQMCAGIRLRSIHGSMGI